MSIPPFGGRRFRRSGGSRISGASSAAARLSSSSFPDSDSRCLNAWKSWPRACAVKGDRRLDGIVRGRVAHRRGLPDSRRDRRNLMPARAGRHSGAGTAIGLPLGGRRVRARASSINSVRRSRRRLRAVSSPNASVPRRQTTQTGSGGAEPRNRRHETPWQIRYHVGLGPINDLACCRCPKPPVFRPAFRGNGSAACHAASATAVRFRGCPRAIRAVLIKHRKIAVPDSWPCRTKSPPIGGLSKRPGFLARA